jgi:hypothetical protein
VAVGRLSCFRCHEPGDMPEGILWAVLRQAGIDPERFLEL